MLGASLPRVGAVLPLFLAACSDPISIRGLVEERAIDRRQVLIAHEGIRDRIPAETSWFAVRDPDLMAELAPGRIGVFGLSAGGGEPRIETFEFLRWAGEDEGWVEAGDRRVRARLAPAFTLEDESGRSVRLMDWYGHVVLLDFIYTRCPGPCPTQTHDHVSIQRNLSEDARAITQFISVTLDPEFDDGPALRAYGEALGVDFDSWSFLTGEIAKVEDVVRRWGIGTSGSGEEELLHTLYTFLIDDRGYVVGRYRSDERETSNILKDIESFARVARGRLGGREEGGG